MHGSSKPRKDIGMLHPVNTGACRHQIIWAIKYHGLSRRIDPLDIGMHATILKPTGRNHRSGWIDGLDAVETPRQNPRNLARTTAEIGGKTMARGQREQRLIQLWRIRRARRVTTGHVSILKRLPQALINNGHPTYHSC